MQILFDTCETYLAEPHLEPLDGFYNAAGNRVADRALALEASGGAFVSSAASS